MKTLKGNAVVAQSGGPTAVTNSSACGVIDEVRRHGGVVTQLFGANNGLLGIIQEDLFDLGAESFDTVTQLRCTPSSAIGSCRYNLGDPARDKEKYRRLLDVFAAHEIRYFYYIGGNDSMLTADKINHAALEAGYDLRVIGLPKTVDNDLLATDHCPGYGSAAKFLATTVMEAGRDTEAMYTFDPVTITETMGRDTGWLAAAAGMARRQPDEAPHLIYVPEIPFSVERFLGDVRAVHRRLGRVFVVVSEGVRDAAGKHVADQGTVDAFGHPQLGGVAECLRQAVTRELGLKARYNKLDTCQRNAIHFASRTDSDEAYQSGHEAVRQALAGQTGMMVTLLRKSQQPYQCTLGLAPLADVGKGVKALPREYLDGAGTHISEAMREYVGPLLRGEVPIRLGSDGLPMFSRFQRQAAPRKLPPFLDKN
jgi:ATP-dependent phosphofructokinase / diphosphate-dependent phosphofructokinase